MPLDPADLDPNGPSINVSESDMARISARILANTQPPPKPGVKMAGGGFVGGNLGVAMGAGVDQYNREREMARMDRMAQIQENADARATEMQPYSLESARLGNSRAGLANEQMGREAELAKAEQPFKLDNVESRHRAQEQEIRNRLAKGEVDYAGAQAAALAHFADAVSRNPAGANRILQQQGFKELMGIKDVSFIPGTKDGLLFTGADGKEYKTTLAAIRSKPELKMISLAPEHRLVGVNAQTGAHVELARGMQKPEPADHQRTLVNDAISQIALAFGAKLDPSSKLLDASSISDPVGYEGAIAEAERRVRGGERPMAVASSIIGQARQAQALRSLPPGQRAKEGRQQADYSSLWTK